VLWGGVSRAVGASARCLARRAGGNRGGSWEGAAPLLSLPVCEAGHASSTCEAAAAALQSLPCPPVSTPNQNGGAHCTRSPLPTDCQWDAKRSWDMRSLWKKMDELSFSRA